MASVHSNLYKFVYLEDCLDLPNI